MRFVTQSLVSGALLGLLCASSVLSQVRYASRLRSTLRIQSNPALACDRLLLARAFSQIGLGNWHVALLATLVIFMAGQYIVVPKDARAYSHACWLGCYLGTG